MNGDGERQDRKRSVVEFRSGRDVLDVGRYRDDRHDLIHVLAEPLREKFSTDDEWRQRSVENIYALLKANAELRALAMKLSDILASRGGWNPSQKDAQ